MKLVSKYEIFHSRKRIWMVVWEMAAILSRGRWVKPWHHPITFLPLPSRINQSTNYNQFLLHIHYHLFNSLRLSDIGSDNGLLPGWHQAIIGTNAGILLIGPLGTNFSEFLIVIHTFSFKKMRLKVSSAKWRPFCLSLNVLITLKPIPITVPAAFLVGSNCWS